MSRQPVDRSGELVAAIAGMRAAAQARYGEALIELTVDRAGVRGTVALPAQAEELRRLLDEFRPTANAHVLVLATRRPRVGLYPEAEPLDVFRERPLGPHDERELTTQLLPGDPPAELLAVRAEQLLVRAAGDAVGWVPGTARFRFGPTARTSGDSLAAVPNHRWDPRAVREAAVNLLGRPYVFGGTGGPGVDCSGLSWRAFLAAGVMLPRNSRAQRKVGARVRLAELREGDLICGVHRGPKRTSHVAIGLGPDEVIHACSECHEVRREPLADFRARYQVLTVRRVPEALSPGR